MNKKRISILVQLRLLTMKVPTMVYMEVICRSRSMDRQVLCFSA